MLDLVALFQVFYPERGIHGANSETGPTNFMEGAGFSFNVNRHMNYE